MKIAKQLVSFTSVLLSNLLVVCSAQQVEFPVLKGPYLGQKPPGKIPEIFAPGIISTIYHEHSSPVYSPDGKEIFYTLSHEGGHRLMYLRLEDGQWTIPKTAPFSGEFSDDNAHFSLDGKRLYFGSRRPIDSLSEEENKLPGWIYRDWYVDKIGDKWPDTATLNTSGAKGQTISGTVYVNILSDQNNPYSNGIYYQTFVNGKYSEPIKMNDDINMGKLKYFGFVDPAERYIMFYSMNRPELTDDTMGLFISFRNADGIWGNAINMGTPINYDGGSTRFPRVSPDGKYLFFNWQKPRDMSNHELSVVEKSFEGNQPYIDNGDVYWVSAQIIQDLKPEEFKID